MARHPDPEDPFLRALGEYWDDVMRFADPQQRELLRGLVEESAETDPVDVRAALQDELLTLLPPDHPLVDVLRTGTMLSTGHRAPADIAVDLHRLRSLVLGRDGRAEPPSPPAAEWPAPSPTEPEELDAFDRAVQARLLELPALSREEVRDRGVDPDDGGLIRLTRPDQEVQVPAFQLAASGGLWPVVREVNELLDAAADPWGVACWWVDRHARLDAAPVELLGRDQDRLLLQAATAVGED